MAYFTESQLRNAARAPLLESHARRIKKYKFEAEVTIFLSHSHKDEELVLGLQKKLAKLGINLYIDWQDSDMPDTPNRETAERIKIKIKELEFFFLLATKNAVESRWVPWELGVADETKNEQRILIVPVADLNGQFHGNEYLQLYRRIVIADNGRFGVFEPQESQGELLEKWLRR